jgi:hypothetical protein
MRVEAENLMLPLIGTRRGGREGYADTQAVGGESPAGIDGTGKVVGYDSNQWSIQISHIP